MLLRVRGELKKIHRRPQKPVPRLHCHHSTTHPRLNAPLLTRQTKRACETVCKRLRGIRSFAAWRECIPKIWPSVDTSRMKLRKALSRKIAGAHWEFFTSGCLAKISRITKASLIRVRLRSSAGCCPAPHRANMLYIGFQASAIGSYVAADGSVYLTQVF